MSDEYITTDEACTILGVSRATLNTYVRQGRVHKYAKGVTRRVFFNRSEIEQLAQIRPVEGDQTEESNS